MTERDLLDPKRDLVFKMQFAQHKDWLIDLVNAVRSMEPPVIDLHVINPEITPEEVKHKLVRLDILAQDSTGQVFNLEMQTGRHAGWGARSVFYLARLLSGQLKEGESYFAFGTNRFYKQCAHSLPRPFCIIIQCPKTNGKFGS